MKKPPLDETSGTAASIPIRMDTVRSGLRRQKMGFFSPYNKWLVIMTQRTGLRNFFRLITCSTS